MPANLANINNLLKTQFLGAVRQVINFQARTVKAMKPGNKKWAGDSIVFPFHSQRSNNVAYGIGGEAAPAALNQQTARVTIPLRQCWGVMRVTYDAKLASRNRAGAFIEATAFEMTNLAKEMVSMAGRSIWGDGTGKLGEVKSYSGGTVTTMRLSDSQGTGLNGNADNRYIRPGMRLDIYTSGGVFRCSATVVSVNITNGTFVITIGTGSNPAITDGLYIQRASGETPINMEPMGIPGIVDDGTNVATLHGVVRATYPIWNANCIDAGTYSSPGNFSEDLIQRAMDASDEAAGEDGNSLMLMHHSTRREVLKTLVQDRRYIEPHSYAAGFKEKNGEGKSKTTLTYNGCPLMVDKDAPWRTIYGVNSEVVRFYEYNEVEWVDDGNGNVMTRVPGSLGLFEAQMAWMYNISTDESGPNSAYCIRNINTSIDRVAQT